MKSPLEGEGGCKSLKKEKLKEIEKFLTRGERGPSSKRKDGRNQKKSWHSQIDKRLPKIGLQKGENRLKQKTPR